MYIKYSILFLIFQCYFLIAFSQLSNDTISTYKHTIGIQLNPAYQSFEEIIWHDDNNKTMVFAIRYGMRIKPSLSVGLEFSGFNLKIFQNETAIHSINSFNYGAFTRFSVNKFQHIKPFAEASFYYTYNKGWLIPEHQTEREYVSDGFIGGYIAPGVSFCLFKDRIRMDIMYKFSPRYLVNSKKSVVSWRISYNFNVKGC
jgi:hypothetical protein